MNDKLRVALVGWTLYGLFAAFALYYIFPENMVEGLRLFVALAVVFVIGGMDYFASRLLRF